jgi:N utilization substance protein B
MTRRSRAREVALQLLFQRDHNAGIDAAAVEQFAHNRLREPGLREFCLSLFNGIVQNQMEIDKRLAAAAENWRVVRMATVDRNVLRLGAYELLFTHETPTAVAFDEAIELARRYGSADSSAFVNGVLDRLRREAAGEQTSAAQPAAEAGDKPPGTEEPPAGKGS